MNGLKETLEYSWDMKVLYAEDNPEIRTRMLEYLKVFFREIIVAVDGEEGLEKFIADSKDSSTDDIKILITDIEMPKMNGLELTQAIHDIDSSIYVMVISAYNEEKYLMQSITLDIQAYVFKPVDSDKFLEALNKIIKKAKIKVIDDETISILKQYQEVANSSFAVSKSDTEGFITFVNDAFCKISGYARHELIGQNHNIVRHPMTPVSVYNEIWNTIKNEKIMWKGVIRNRSKSGKSYYIKNTIRPILDKNGEITEYIAMIDEITDIMNPRKQLDDLTADNNDYMIALIKLEDFSNIKKIYGTELSRKIEDNFADYLKNQITPDCHFENFYALGNGEYAFAGNKVNEMISVVNIEESLKELQAKMSGFTMKLEEIEYDPSVIISFAYDDNALEDAFYGMGKLIEENKNFIIANNLVKAENLSAETNLETIKKIKLALSNNKIISYYQPIINNKTQEIIKYESLVRLEEENGKILSPFFFLEISKKGKYYSRITNQVLENSFDVLSIIDEKITINLSVLDIESNVIRAKIFELLEEHKDNAHRIVFELLEDEETKDFELVKDFIKNVKAKGVKIAIDDFGSGYSNFERLLDYQPDIIKIDSSLIKNIATNQFSYDVVSTIVSFAKKQNIETIGEFVENEAIFKIMQELGVDYSQGYYFGKPEAIER